MRLGLLPALGGGIRELARSGQVSRLVDGYLRRYVEAFDEVVYFSYLSESLDEFTGTYFVGVPDVTTLPLLMFNASMGGNYQIASITALLLLVPSIGFMLVVERFLKANVLAMVGR